MFFFFLFFFFANSCAVARSIRLESVGSAGNRESSVHEIETKLRVSNDI